MGRRLTAAALLMPLACATPAPAQDVESRERPGALFGPSLSGIPDQPAQAGQTAISPVPISSPPSGIRVTETPFIREDGSRGYRRTLVGSMDVTPDVRVGIGLFSVTRTSHKERAMARTQPMKDVGGRENRIAAVGLSFSF